MTIISVMETVGARGTTRASGIYSAVAKVQKGRAGILFARRKARSVTAVFRSLYTYTFTIRENSFIRGSARLLNLVCIRPDKEAREFHF